MVRREDADEAVKDPNPTIDGRRANLRGLATDRHGILEVRQRQRHGG